MSDEKKSPGPVIPIDSLSSVSYDPSTGALLLVYPQPIAVELGMTMEISVCLGARATEMLLSSIRAIETKLGGPIEVPENKHFLQ